jgi:hypothetical protein
MACLLVGLLDFSSTLKMEALCSSEKPVATQRTTRRHVPEDVTLQFFILFPEMYLVPFADYDP